MSECVYGRGGLCWRMWSVTSFAGDPVDFTFHSSSAQSLHEAKATGRLTNTHMSTITRRVKYLHNCEAGKRTRLIRNGFLKLDKQQGCML